MKRTVTLLISVAIIAAFGIAALLSLTPDASRDGKGEHLPTTPPSSFTKTEENTTPVSTETSQNQTPDPVDTTVSDSSSTPTPPTPDKPTVFFLTGQTQSKEYKYGNKKVATISFYLPEITSSTPVESLEIINAYLKEESRSLMAGYEAECQQLVDEYSQTSMEKYSYNAVSKMYFSQNIISVRMQIDISYGPGSGDQIIFCFNFSIDSGELLTLDDVVTDKPKLIDKAIESCEKLEFVELSAGYESYISTKICNEWYIKDNCMYLVYKPYEIASGVAGTIELCVSGDFIKL